MTAMGRPPTHPAPTYTRDQALDAARRIHDLRAARPAPGRPVNDPELDVFWPPILTDDTDLAAVVDYVQRHRAIPPAAAAAELPDWALLVEYLRQRADHDHKRRLWAVLTTGHQLEVPARVYGKALGLPSRSAVHNRRVRLDAELHGEAPHVPTPAERAADAAMGRWLTANRNDLLDVGAVLVDHRDRWVALAAPHLADQLAEAIDAVGMSMTARPSRSYAGAIAYAIGTLRAHEPEHLPAELAAAYYAGLALHAAYNELR